MDDAGLSVNKLAAEVGVDSKSAERWVTVGRLPRMYHRAKIAQLLNCEQFVIWPEAAVDIPGSAGGELVTLYPARRDVPVAVWKSLMASTRSEFTLHAFAATFLPDQVMDMSVELIKLTERGVRVRLLLGDPAIGRSRWGRGRTTLIRRKRFRIERTYPTSARIHCSSNLASTSGDKTSQPNTLRFVISV